MSVERKPVIKKLSKGVLDLKFMKKSKEKVKQLEEDEERKNLYQDQLANLHSSEDKVVLVGSHYDIMDYLPCRLSFGGVDAQIEKLNAPNLKGLYEPVKEEVVRTNEEDVTKEEMAEHFSTINENLAKRFNPDQYKGYKRPNDKASSSTRGKRGRFQHGKRGGTFTARGGFEQGRGRFLVHNQGNGLEQGRGRGLEQGRGNGLEQGRGRGLEQGRGKGFEQGRGKCFEQGRGKSFEHNNRRGFERGRRGIKRNSKGEYSSINKDSFQYIEVTDSENKADYPSQEKQNDYKNIKFNKNKRGHFKNSNRMKNSKQGDYATSVNNCNSEFSSQGKRTKFGNDSEI